MFSQVKNFVLENLYAPLLPGTEPYNVYNTLLYAALFAGLTVYLLLPALKKMDVEKNKAFYISLTPWIMTGGAISAIHELQIANSILLSPPVLTAGLILVLTGVIKAGEYFRGRIRPLYFIFSSGSLIFVPLLSVFSFGNLEALRPFAVVTALWLVPGLLFLKALRPRLFSLGFVAPVAAHYLDATSTVVALSFGAVEQQLVAARLIEIMGPYGIFVLKTAVIVPAVLIIDREIEDDKEKMFYMFVIAALGLGITVRNLILLLSGF